MKLAMLTAVCILLVGIVPAIAQQPAVHPTTPADFTNADSANAQSAQPAQTKQIKRVEHVDFSSWLVPPRILVRTEGDVKLGSFDRLKVRLDGGSFELAFPVDFNDLPPTP